MNATRKARSAERPPSPKAPTGSRFRRRRTRVATGAAVVSLALASALGPAAADEILPDEAGANSASARSQTSDVGPRRNPVVLEDMAKDVQGPSQAEKELLYLTLAQQRADESKLVEAVAAHEAQRAAAEAAAAEAAAVEAAAAEEAAQAEAAEEPEAQEAQEAPSSGGSAPSVASGSVWDSLAQCESGGNWAINSGNGYSGGLQFSLSTWGASGGSGLPHENSREAQIAVAQRVQASQGWGAWPSCSRQLGLR